MAPCVWPGSEALPPICWPETGSPDFSPLGVSERKDTRFPGCTGADGMALLAAFSCGLLCGARPWAEGPLSRHS